MKKVLKISKNYAAAIVAVLLAVGMMSFNMNTAADLFVWYERTAPDQYELMDINPSAEPSNGCISEEAELCAKGFEQVQVDETQIKDNTLAEDRHVKD